MDIKTHSYLLAICFAFSLLPAPALAQYDEYISQASELYDIPEAFIRAVIRVESNFNPRCRSSVGAMGLMQLMPETARSMGVTHPYDPYQNIMGGTRFLRILANRYSGNVALVLAAYNAGAGRVDLYLSGRRSLPEITVRRYIPRVLSRFREYSARV
jgi:soluble lytic murein transglycosylase-like protein